MSPGEGSHESIEREESSDVPPADRPRTRVTLLRWMILIAVVAICFAWVNSSIVAVILVPVAFAAMVPRGKSWSAIETCAAVGWLLGAIVEFSGLQPDFFEFLLLFGSGVAIGISWLFRLIREIMGRRIRRNLLSWAITPLIGLTGGMLARTEADFDFRLRLSEPALRASAALVTAKDTGKMQWPDRWLGLIHAKDTEEAGGCVIWWTDGGFLDRYGLAYYPGPGSPQTIPGLGDYSMQRIRGPWWKVIQRW